VRPETGWATTSAYAAKLIASDGRDNDGFGYSVAVSGDTVVAGAPDDDVGSQSNQGSAYVYVRPETGWLDTTQTAKLTAGDGTGGDKLGTSVAVSGDTVVVGAYAHDVGSNSGQGSAYVYVRPVGN
jgi:hypothetical protein